MKLERLSLVNFLNHKSTELDFSRRVNLIVGPNGAGKSAILEAWLYLITGLARSTDEAGRGSGGLVRLGTEDRMEVRGTVLQGGKRHEIRRGREHSGPFFILSDETGNQADGKAAENILEAKIGPRALVAAVLDSPRLFLMDKRKRSDLLASCIDLDLDLASLAEEARTYGISEPALRVLRDGLEKMGAGSAPVGPKGLAEAHARIYKRRAEVKAERNHLAARVADLSLEDPRDLQKKLEAINIDELAGKATIAQESLVRAKALEEERYRLNIERGTLELKLQKITQDKPEEPAQGELAVPAPSEEEIEKRVRELERREENLSVEFVAKAAKRQEVTEELEEAKKAAKEGKGATACDGRFAPSPCPIAEPATTTDKVAQEAKQRERIEELERKLREASDVVDLARKKHSDSKNTLEAAREALRLAREHKAHDAGAAEEIERQLQKVRTRLDEIGNSPALLEAAQRTAAEADKARIRALEEKVRLAQEIGEAERGTKLRDELRILKGQVAIFEELTQALDQKGLPTQILQKRAGGLSAQINKCLDDVTGGEYSVAFVVDDGLELEVSRRGGGGPIPTGNLSTSERLRLGVSIAHALALATGLGFLAIDRAELLDGAGRASLGCAILDWDLDSIIIAATRDNLDGVTSSDAQGVFWVSGGEVGELKGRESPSNYHRQPTFAELDEDEESAELDEEFDKANKAIGYVGEGDEDPGPASTQGADSASTSSPTIPAGEAGPAADNSDSHPMQSSESRTASPPASDPARPVQFDHGFAPLEEEEGEELPSHVKPCRGCGEPAAWIKTLRDKWILCDRGADGEFPGPDEIFDRYVHRSHWGSCPERDKFRGGGKR